MSLARASRSAGPAAASRRRVRTVRVVGAVAVASLFAAGLTGCSRFSSAENAPAGAHESAPAAPGEPQASADASAGVLSAYRGYWDSAVTAWSRGSLTGVPLDRYAVGQADSAVRAALESYHAAGVVTEGRPQLNPAVTALDLSASPYTATVTDCVDESAVVTVSSTGSRHAAAHPGHHPASYQAQYQNGWRIVSGAVDLSRGC
jgi:hypothetical protein